MFACQVCLVINFHGLNFHCGSFNHEIRENYMPQTFPGIRYEKLVKAIRQTSGQRFLIQEGTINLSRKRVNGCHGEGFSSMSIQTSTIKPAIVASSWHQGLTIMSRDGKQLFGDKLSKYPNHRIYIAHT